MSGRPGRTESRFLFLSIPLRGSISYDWSQFQAQVLRRGRSRARDHYHVTTESAVQHRSRTERGPTEPRPHHSEACSSVCTKLKSLPKQKKCQEGGRWLWEKALLPCRSQLESDYIFSHLLPSTSGWSWLSWGPLLAFPDFISSAPEGIPKISISLCPVATRCLSSKQATLESPAWALELVSKINILPGMGTRGWMKSLQHGPVGVSSGMKQW